MMVDSLKLVATAKPIEVAMSNIHIVEMTSQGNINAHNSIEELREPDELNELIMTKVNSIVERLSRQGDVGEVRGDIAVLTALLRIRKCRDQSRIT
jgi:hypothetical protein